MYRTIAIGTDGSETASIAERVALELARTSGGRMLFVSVYPDEAGMQRSADAVKTAKARAEAAGVAVGTKTMRAEPAEGIVELADRGDAGLVVVGDGGMGGRRTLRAGSVPDRVSHSMPCDLLIVRTSKPERAKPAGEYGSVLIATDGSPTADRAARVGAEFARALGAGITLVHVGDESVGEIVLHDAAERPGDRHMPIKILKAMRAMRSRSSPTRRVTTSSSSATRG